MDFEKAKIIFSPNHSQKDRQCALPVNTNPQMVSWQSTNLGTSLRWNTLKTGNSWKSRNIHYRNNSNWVVIKSLSQKLKIRWNLYHNSEKWKAKPFVNIFIYNNADSLFMRNSLPRTTPNTRLTGQLPWLMTYNIFADLTRIIIWPLWAFEFKYYEYLDKLVGCTTIFVSSTHAILTQVDIGSSTLQFLPINALQNNRRS